jgi:hypothetical protein
MSAKSIQRWVVFCLLLCLVLMALFPLPFGQGPFNSVNGPTTAFRAYRSATLILTTLALLATVLVTWLSTQTGVMDNGAASDHTPRFVSGVFTFGASLRC